MTTSPESLTDLSTATLQDGVSRLNSGRVLCVGDIMLDKFVYGNVERISPEAPIPVLHVQREKKMLGGVGNVAANIASLGGQTVVIAVTGNDDADREVRAVMQAQGITAAMVAASDRQTTVKTRFVSGTQQVLRVDEEKTAAIPQAAEQEVLKWVDHYIGDVGAVILSDYKKGVLTDAVIQGVMSRAKAAGVTVIVDPKDKNFARYAGADIITPNRKELEAATGSSCADDSAVEAAVRDLQGKYNFGAVLATRSQQGMSYLQLAHAPQVALHIPAQVREIFDVSGAGDTVIATLALGCAAGLSRPTAVMLSNLAAGIVVGKPGTATVRSDELLQAIAETTALVATGGDNAARGSLWRGAAARKQMGLAAAVDDVNRRRVKGQIIGFTNGCFDLLHPGHLSSLRQARAACDYLVVAINSDASVRKLKGPTRPVQDEATRSDILASLEMVDCVLIFDTDTPMPLLEALRPDVLVKGGQYKLEEVVGYELLQSYGGKIVRADMEDGFSTTNTIARMAS